MMRAIGMDVWAGAHGELSGILQVIFGAPLCLFADYSIWPIVGCRSLSVSDSIIWAR